MQTSFLNKDLTAWEKYMLADDTRRYPMTCHIRFWFDGKWNRECFEQALLDCLNRHPMLRAMLQNKKDDWRWNFCEPDLEHQLKWINRSDMVYSDEVAHQLCDWSSQDAPDLRSQFTMIQFARQKSLLLVRFHHAVSDGIGIFNAVEDLLDSYDRISQGLRPQQREIDISESKSKRSTTLTDFASSFRNFTRRIICQIKRVRNYFLNRPVVVQLTDRVHQIDDSTHHPSGLGAVVREVCSQEFSEALRLRAKEEGVTVNDLILVAIYGFLADMLQSRAQNELIRLAVPINLRTEDSPRQVKNEVSMVFIDRTIGQCADQSLLLRSIVNEMREIKVYRLGWAMINALRFITTSSRLTRRVLGSRLANCSMVVTNLGRPFHLSKLLDQDGHVTAGGVKITGVDTMPPLRCGTTLALSVNGYGGSLSLSLRFDSRQMSLVDAKVMLKNLVRHLNQVQKSESIEGRMTTPLPEVLFHSSV